MASAMPTTGMTAPEDLHQNHSYKLLVTTIVSLIIATIGLSGRFVARYICCKRLELNDYLMIAGYIMKLGLTIVSSLLIDYGIGQHIYVLTAEQINNFLRATWTGSFIYAPSIAFIKLSILSLYYVAFPSRLVKTCVWVLGAITAAWGIALCLVGLLSCIPVDKFWNPTMPGHCINQQAYYWGLQIPNIVTDFLILFLPFRDIYLLHLPSTQLLQIAGVLSLGLVTCAIDIVRLVIFIDIPVSMDVTWVDLAPAMWLDLEVSIALLCACLPVMRPLLHPGRFYRANRNSGTGGTIETAPGGDYEEVESQLKNGQAMELESSGSNRSSRNGKFRISGGSESDTFTTNHTQPKGYYG